MKNMKMDNMAVRFSIKPEIAAQRLVKAAKDKKEKEKTDNDKASKQDETVSRNLFSWVNYVQLCKLLGLK